MTLDQLLDALDASPDLETSLEAVLTERKRKRAKEKAGMAKLDLPGDASMPRDQNGDLVTEHSVFGLHAPTGDDDLALEGSVGLTVGGLSAPGAEDEDTKTALINMLLSNETGDAFRVTAERKRRENAYGLTPPSEDM